MNLPNKKQAMDIPRTQANEILKEHGPAGWLVRRLQRYALLGWALFFLVLILHFLLILAGTLAPRPVVAVDAAGHVLGTFEYLAPSTRSDDEIIASGKRFAVLFMSLNSATVFEDYAEAMNMMGPQLLAATELSLKSDNYLSRVAKARARSWLEFAPNGVRITARSGLNAQVRLAGNIMIDAGGGPVSKPFDLTLETQAVARNTTNTGGILILARKDN